MDAEYYRVNRPDVIDEHFDQEYVVVNLRTGIYFSLNRTASHVWTLLNQKLSRAAILAELERSYATEPERISDDLNTLLVELQEEKLILVEPAAHEDLTGPLDSDREAPADYIAPAIEKFSDMEALLLLDPIHQVDDSGWPGTNPNVR